MFSSMMKKSKKICKTLVLSMKKRVKSVLENKGGHINY